MLRVSQVDARWTVSESARILELASLWSDPSFYETFFVLESGDPVGRGVKEVH